jgi:fibronectin type 3 domain-containing protein
VPGYVSNEVLATTAAAAPSNLTAVAGTGQVTLRWASADGAASYNVYRSTTPGGEGSTPVATGIVGTTFLDTGLAGGTTYYYRVTSVAGNAESVSTGEAFATPAAVPLPPPSNVFASAGAAQVTLTWSPVAGATSYNIYRSATPGGEGSTPFTTVTSGTGFIDSSVSAGKTYYYQVTAVNAAGESSRGAEASAAVPQQRIAGDANGDGKVDFSDLLIVAQNYGMKSGATVANGDFNGDGTIGFQDLLILAQNYGKGVSALLAELANARG